MAAAAVAVVALSVLAVFSRWGVLIAVSLAVVAGLGIWVWRRGFVFVEIAAFLIHFDGIGAGPVRMGRIVAAAALVLVVAKLASGWRPPALPVRHWVPIGLLAVWVVVSGFWSPEGGAWFFAIGQLGLGLAFFATAGLLCDTHRLVQQFLRGFWVGGLFGSAAGILALVIGTRSVGFGADPNFFGLLQASMVPLTVYYRRHAPTPQLRHFYGAVLVLVLAGAAGAGSRSGLIGASIAIVATMVTRPGLDVVRRARVSISAVLLAGLAFLIGFVANPANLQRGFNDRGAGRVDLWNTTLALIEQRPFLGYGFGQVKGLIPPNLLLTPGSQRLNDFRPDVSAHNTWLDVQGDLGVIGLMIFTSVLLVALWGLARPRWRETKELSTTLFVMTLPVMSSSFFLPLTNNKLFWSIVGLSAALQVPSMRSRWPGLNGRPEPELAVSADPSTALVAAAAGPPAPRRSVAVARLRPNERPELPGDEVWEAVPLARWDRRITRRCRIGIATSAVVGMLLGVMLASSVPTTWSATASVFIPRVDGTANAQTIAVDRTRLQGALTMMVSGAYAQELGALSGVDLDTAEIRERLDATRPRMGAYLEVTFTDGDEQRVEAVAPHLIDALDNVYGDAYDFAFERATDQARPTVPGESRVYDGPAYLRLSDDSFVALNPPRAAWFGFLGAVLGGLVALGVVLVGQRRPRISPADDLVERTGLAVWGRLSGGSRRARPTRNQFAQVVSSARSASPSAPESLRIVVTSPGPDPAVPALAIGVATELAVEGCRVVLVDAGGRRSARMALLGMPARLLAQRRGLSGVALGRADLASALSPVRPWQLPRSLRPMLRGAPGAMRVLHAGSRRSRRRVGVAEERAVLDELDASVCVVVLAPPLLSGAPRARWSGWGDAVVVGTVDGRSTTDEVEDAAALASARPGAPAGLVVMSA